MARAFFLEMPISNGKIKLSESGWTGLKDWQDKEV
jgi:hypothetical protein